MLYFCFKTDNELMTSKLFSLPLAISLFPPSRMSGKENYSFQSLSDQNLFSLYSFNTLPCGKMARMSEVVLFDYI